MYLSDKHNLTATAAPGATDDRSAGYTEGTGRHNCSRWINTLTGIEYICIDATVGAARWMVNEYAGTSNVAGLNAALGSAAETATRMSISENFTKRPALASSITGALTTAVNLIPFRSIQALGAAAKSFDIRDKDIASMEQAA